MNITELLFSFNGRIRRTNYWLGAIGSSVVLGIVAMIIIMSFGGGAAMMMRGGGGNVAGGGLAIVGVILYFAILVVAVWIGLALQIKRWHDRDKGGIWVLINFIPLIGGLWTLVECGFMDGTPGPNQYGPSPKGITGPPEIAPAAPVAT